jgi:alpha-tubulin suppressor-like RCC1 family protein
MQRRSGRVFTVLVPVFAAMFIASCGKDVGTGPRIATLSAVSGGGQQAPGGTILPQPLVVRAEDQSGAPVAGVTVIWSAVTGGGSVNPSTSISNDEGLAITLVTLGTTVGANTFAAQLGQSDPIIFSVTATAVVPSGSGPINYVAISAGTKHSCALSVGGVAYCWGFNGDGQLGIGEVAAGSGPVFASPQPTASTGGVTFGKLFGGTFHTCGLSLSGVAQCWGVNVDGRLGIGDFETVTEPTPVEGTRAFSSISAGQAHACGLDLSGLALCWGRNVDGQLGLANGVVPVVHADSVAIAVPTLVRVNPPTPFLAIAAGGLHTCAISGNPALDLSGPATCWGNNGGGQLGNGTSGINVWSTVPTPVSGGLSFTSITSGDLHSCALDTSGSAYCWGSSASGQLGSGAGASSVPVIVSGGLTFASITGGRAHTCGRTFAGAVYCWGSNASGQLGDGTTTARFSPTLVSGGLIFASVSAGSTHTCGITVANLAYCWGDNQFGQLGDLSTTNRLVPTKVAFQP